MREMRELTRTRTRVYVRVRDGDGGAWRRSINGSKRKI